MEYNKVDLFHIKTKEKIGVLETPFTFIGDCVSQGGYINPGPLLLTAIKKEQERIWSGIFEGRNSMFIFVYVKLGKTFKPIQLNRFGSVKEEGRAGQYMTTINTLFDNMDYFAYLQRGY